MSESPSAQRALALRLLPLLDLTSLGEDDTPGQIRALCESARSPWGWPAALCVYPEHVTTVRETLAGAPVAVATVVNFPDGSTDEGRVRRETQRALAAGADEIDLVFPWRSFLQGEHAVAERVVAACRDACTQGARLKLILETGMLGSDEAVRAASRLGLRCEVDFLKTSTGKVAINATPGAAAIMLDEIAATGGRCGFKVAGGVRRAEDAALYLDLAQARLGSDWVGPARFRIGASALFGALQQALAVPA